MRKVLRAGPPGRAGRTGAQHLRYRRSALTELLGLEGTRPRTASCVAGKSPSTARCSAGWQRRGGPDRYMAVSSTTPVNDYHEQRATRDTLTYRSDRAPGGTSRPARGSERPALTKGVTSDRSPFACFTKVRTNGLHWTVRCRASYTQVYWAICVRGVAGFDTREQVGRK